MRKQRKAKIDPVYASIGALVRKFRLSAEMTQDSLAERATDHLGSDTISRESVANVERGVQQLPLHKAAALARALGVTVDHLLPRASVIVAPADAIAEVPERARAFVAGALDATPKVEE